MKKKSHISFHVSTKMYFLAFSPFCTFSTLFISNIGYIVILLYIYKTSTTPLLILY